MPACTKQDVDAFLAQLPNYDAVFYKSLARNDHQWADGLSSHQSGVLIPRDAISFFGLPPAPAENTAEEVRVFWLLGGRVYERADFERPSGHTQTCIRYYQGGNRADRPESHLTCVYNPYFQDLDDGALLLVGRLTGEETRYNAIIIAPDSDELLTEVIGTVGLPDAPYWGIVSLTDEDLAVGPDLSELLLSSARRLYEASEGLPPTQAMADEVWRLLRQHEEFVRGEVACPGIAGARSPFQAAVSLAPGDLVRWMHERVEFTLLRHIERWHYPPRVCAAIREQHRSYPADWTALSDAIGLALEPIITVSKTITQSRRSRAGQSFENHVARLLDDWGLEYERQVGEERMDFVVCGPGGALPLSAKTTTRERWRQVPDGTYFITLDRQVGPGKLSEIVDRDIRLVVPERDKLDIRHYADSPHVIRFRDLRDALR